MSFLVEIPTRHKNPGLQYLEVLQTLNGVEFLPAPGQEEAVRMGRRLYDAAAQIRGAGLCTQPSCVLWGEPPEGGVVGRMIHLPEAPANLRSGAALAKALARPEVPGWWMLFAALRPTLPRAMAASADRFLSAGYLIGCPTRGVLLVTPKGVAVVREA